jgi:hypothetical protein
LLDEDQQLRGVAFSEVIFDTTGKRVFSFDANDPADQRVAKAIGAACDETLKQLNAPGSAIQTVDRINEVSSHFEDNLRKLLNATPGFRCDFPLTAEGKVQRSGYPDLRIIDLDSKRIFYLDPNFTPPEAATSVSGRSISSPKKRPTRYATTRYISSSASSMNRGPDRTLPSSMWKFTRWDLVDLSQFKVKLKAEFQGSNRDMYRPEAIVASGGGD